MRKIGYIKLLILVLVVQVYSACTSKGDKRKSNSDIENIDILEIIYSTADSLNMNVMCDIDLKGGNLYQKSTIEKLTQNGNQYIEKYYKRYGHHPSFWGWYLNNEINPIENTDHEQSYFWRTVWKSVVEKCHQVAPDSKVTISPFFLLDKESLRGFKYLEPAEYEEWWYNTMKETGIDILMIQDSGAEHLSFFTIADREPFLQAFAEACKRAGKEFWVNVETGQVKATDWDHALQMEKDFNRAWEFTEIEWLKQKLNLAAKYGSEIINWGYYPLMAPNEDDKGITLKNVDGQEVDISSRKLNYQEYKAYVDTLSNHIPEGMLTQPKLNGTLWGIPSDIAQMTKEEAEKAIKQEIQCQKDLGFSFVWIVNTPDHF